MQKTIARIENLILKGSELTEAAAEIRSVQFELLKLDSKIVQAVSEKYGAPLLEPCATRPNYQTTILTGKTKVIVVSKKLKYNLKFIE